ncbi:MAG: carboxylesterase, partial [Dokdonella sp.]
MILSCVEIETAPSPRHAVIWMHGLGANGHDFEPIVPELVAADWPPLRFVFPNAPSRSVTVNNGMRMPAWYDIKGFEIAQRQDEVGIRESIVQIEALIAREIERGVPVGSIILAGFSQGAAIALSVGLRHAGALAGIVALSGYLPMHESLAAEAAPANRQVPIFIGHGSAD